LREQQAKEERKLHEEHKDLREENVGIGDDSGVPTVFPEVPMAQLQSKEFTSSNEDKENEAHRRRFSANNHAPLMPKGVTGPAEQKTEYQRPKRDRLYCKQCASHPEGFRGEHELRRHIDREHKGMVKRWICVEPKDGLSHPKPILPLSRCKACHQEKKKYTAYYNAAAHLRRAHFKPKKPHRNGIEKRGGMTVQDWPPMVELKYWMKEIEVVALGGMPPNTQPFRDISKDLEGLDNSLIGLGGILGANPFGDFNSTNFGTSFDPSPDQIPLTAEGMGRTWATNFEPILGYDGHLEEIDKSYGTGWEYSPVGEDLLDLTGGDLSATSFSKEHPG
jgi:hypothetical protein